MIPFSWYLFLAVVLFVIGTGGFLTRNNVLVRWLSLVLMVAGGSLNLVAMDHFQRGGWGQLFTVCLLMLSTAQAAVFFGLTWRLRREQGKAGHGQHPRKKECG